MSPDSVVSFNDFPEYLQPRRIVPKYDAQTEPKPVHAWYSFDKDAVDALLKVLAHIIIDVLKGAPEDDTELQHVARAALSLSHVLRSPAIKIALLGAQGAGKSLTINAIFDLNGLSLTGADGAACTSSVTKYVYYPRSKTGNDMFYAELKFLTREKREALLKEHARSYYFYHNGDDDSDDEDDSPRSKPLKQNDMDQSLKDTAQDVFTTLFGSLDEFHDSWSAPAYKSGEFVRLCQLKCDEALVRENVDSEGIATKLAANQTDLLEQLRPFMTNIKGKRCLWPLVDCITVKFYHPLLEHGIELFDLPGWGDINLSRVRHAEEIKGSVDVEILLADTIRIASEAKLVNGVRAAISHHGSSNVKVACTKIDALTKNQLAQCVGENYDDINKLLLDLEEEEEAALEEEDEDDDEVSKKRRMLESYRLYLERTRKQRKIIERTALITAELESKLQGRSKKDMPQVFHISASDYMEWNKRPKISYTNQPALSVAMTGIPAIRQFLLELPAEQNLKDYERHINVTIPAFLEKIKRTVSDADRDGGFITIADEFDALRKGFMSRLLSQAKSAFKDASDNAMARFKPDIPSFKEQLEEKMTEDWFAHKGAAFTRILKCRGVVPKGMSKAKSLEEGCNWNKELATMVASGFSKWSNAHTARMKLMAPALRQGLESLHKKTASMINDSAANLVTVEKAKRKWAPLRKQVQVKLMTLMDEVEKLDKIMYECATMEFDEERNLVAYITDDIYAEVFEAEPEQKPPIPGTKKQYKRYVTPKIRFQKKLMEELFLSPENHFVDRMLQHFQTEFDEAMDKLLIQHFEKIEKLLEDFSRLIRAEAPIQYRVTPEGEALRADLAERIPTLLEKDAELRSKLPRRVKHEDELVLVPFDSTGIDESDEDLSLIIDKMARKKRAEPQSTTNLRAKRIKSEHS